MAPSESASGKQLSFPRLDYPTLRDSGPRIPWQWLHGKRLADGAQGLWRVHDKLYDLTTFAAQHPGGMDWIAITKGTDITEAFETHHIDGGAAERLLPVYFVREASTPRNSPFTFLEGGFYRTLKAAVRSELSGIDAKLLERLIKQSDFVTDACCAAVVLLTPAAAWLTCCWLPLAVPAVLLAGLALSALTVCAHNYFHRRDNWRMYLFNISGFNYLEWRVSHALSHHLHTNTAQDVELSMLEPFLQYLPRADKPLWAQLAALYFPIVYPFVSIGYMVKGFATAILDLESRRGEARWSDLLPLALPAWMCLAAGSVPHALAAWLGVTLVASFVFMVVGLTAGHHSNTNFFDGDVPRSQTPDWGEHQLDTVVERSEYMGNHALSLTRFGDHALHHLFPTLDHALLPRLYPTLRRVCAERDLRLRTTTQLRAIVEQSRQLARRKRHDFAHKPPLLARM